MATVYQGCSQEFGFTKAKLKEKVLHLQGVWGGCAPQKLTQYIKVNFNNLLNSYDYTMDVIVSILHACCKNTLYT